MKPRYAQEDHTHVVPVSSGWLPDFLLGFGATLSGNTLTVRYPTAGSAPISAWTSRHSGATLTSAWGSGGQRGVNQMNLVPGYTRASGWRTRSVFGSDASWTDCPARFAGMVKEYQATYPHNNFMPYDPVFSPGWMPSPPDAQWTAPSTIIGDSTYYTSATLTKTTDYSWTFDCTRTGGTTWGRFIIGFLENGTAFPSLPYGGIQAASPGFPWSHTITSPTGTDKIVGVYGALQAPTPLLQPDALAVDGAGVPQDPAGNFSGSWMTQATLAAGWIVFLQDGYAPPAPPMPTAMFTGVRAFAPRYGTSADPKWEFYSHASTVAVSSSRPTWMPAAATNRGPGSGVGLGFRQESTIDCVPGRIYALMSECEPGGTTVGLTLKDMTSGTVDSCVVPAGDVPSEQSYGYTDVLVGAGFTTANTPRLYWVDYRGNVPTWQTP